MTRIAALIALHVAVALFGFAALFGKWLTLSPAAIVLGRTVVAAATLTLVLALQRAATLSAALGPVPVPPRGRLNTEAGAGVPAPGRTDELNPPERAETPTTARANHAGLALNGLLLAVHWVTFFAAVQVATVAIALLGFASFPVFVLALESVERRRVPNGAEGGAVLVVTMGVALLVPELRWSNVIVQGLAWGIASGLTFALLAVRNRRAVERHGAVALALWQNLCAAACLLPWVLLQGGAAVLSPRDVLLVLILGVVCTALAHTLFIASMRRVSAHAASVVTVLEPVYGIALAAALLGERPDLRTLAGAALILVAALVATRQAAR